MQVVTKMEAWGDCQYITGVIRVVKKGYVINEWPLKNCSRKNVTDILSLSVYMFHKQ